MKKFEKVEKTGIISTKFSLRCTPSVILGIQFLFFFTILLAQTVLVDKAAVKDLICCLKKRVEDKHCLHEKGLDANIGLKSFLNFHNCTLSFQKNE